MLVVVAAHVQVMDIQRVGTLCFTCATTARIALSTAQYWLDIGSSFKKYIEMFWIHE